MGARRKTVVLNELTDIPAYIQKYVVFKEPMRKFYAQGLGFGVGLVCFCRFMVALRRVSSVGTGELAWYKSEL